MLLIQTGLTESLAVRFELLHLWHWSFSEMEKAFGFSLEKYIYFGGYPGAVQLIEDEQRWRNYILDSLVETSISKDILMLTRVDKPALLKRLFELGTLYSGQVLSFSKIMGQLQDAGNSTTLSHYLKLLSDAGLLGGIEKYAGNTLKKRSSSPKFQVYNNALLTAMSSDTFEKVVIDPKKWGRLVESAIGSHLINYSVSDRYGLYYWRENNYEIDFVIEKSGKLIGLEVKSGRRAENMGMKIFAQQFNPSKTFIVGTGGIGIAEFLRISPSDLF
jgi:predicted AAA+ superfamily ATPase